MSEKRLKKIERDIIILVFLHLVEIVAIGKLYGAW